MLKIDFQLTKDPSLVSWCTQSVGDPKTGVYFYEKCLEISRLTRDRRGNGIEPRPRFVISVHERGGGGGEVPRAAFGAGNERCCASEEQAAAKELVKVYLKIAEEKEKDDDHEGAVGFYQKASRARSSPRSGSEGWRITDWEGPTSC